MYGKSLKTGSCIYHTYHIETMLGSGGSGSVYKAWHTRLRKHVVIKHVKNCSADTIEVRRNEVEALKNIRNQYVPQVLDFLEESDHCITVIEHIEGESLDKLLIQEKRFDEDQIIQWYRQLTSALCAIHRYDVCHRDIKPANILLTTNGDMCLIDFNFALVSGNNTGVISRSIGYASPEQNEYFKLCRCISNDTPMTNPYQVTATMSKNDCLTEPVKGIADSGEAVAGEHNLRENKQNGADLFGNCSYNTIDWKLSDIFSLGATIYHLLTGMRPPIIKEEIEKIPDIEGYSESTLKIIEKSMKTNPTQRYKSAIELNSVLYGVNYV